MRTFLVGLAFLLSVAGAFAQSPIRSVYTVNTIAELESLRPGSISSGGRAVVDVLGYYEPGDWGGRRSFHHDATNAEPRDGGHVFTNAAAAGRWISSDRFSDHQSATLWGLVGDGTFNNADRFDALLALSTNRTIHIELPRGDYVTTRVIRKPDNHPVRITSGSGGYTTGWLPAETISESRIIYTGPMTNRFVDLTPTVGFRYGLNIEGVTFDANGLAKEAIHIERNTRGFLEQPRAINATERNMVVENSYDLVIAGFSSSSNEEPFIVPTPIAVAFTNQANGNVLIAPTISGTSEAAVDISDSSKVNTLMGGAIESNQGRGIRIRASANENAIRGQWQEAQGSTNWIQIDAGALHTSIEGVYFENRLGRVNVDGSHSRIMGSSFGALNFGDSAGANRAEDLFLGIGLLPTGNLVDQNIWNVKDATALLMTNTLAASLALRGETFELFNRTNAYALARLGRDRIVFGDGLTGEPGVGWYRASSVSVGTTNTILQIVSSPSSALLSGYAAGDSIARMSIFPTGISLGSGSNPPTASISYYAPATVIETYGSLVIRTNLNDTLLGGYPVGSAQPSFFLTIDGAMRWGLGGTNPTDTGFKRIAPLKLQVDNDLLINGELTLGGVARSSWPSGTAGAVAVYTNDFTTSKTFWSSMGSQLLLISNHVGATVITLSTNQSPTNATPPQTGTSIAITDLGDTGASYTFGVAGDTNTVSSYGRCTQDWIWSGSHWVFLGIRPIMPPQDGSTYGVKYGQWSPLPIVSDAPSDGQTYGRLNGGWATVGGGGGGGGTNHNSLTGLEGGGGGHYYHLSATDFTDLTDGGDSALHYHAGDRNRTNHIGTQPWSTILDADTNVWQKLIAVLRRGNGLHFGTNSGANTLTLSGNYLPGANITATTNADGSITLSAATGGTNSGTTVSVDGGAALSAANFADTSEIDGTATGTNVSFALKTTGVGAGTYTGLVATVDTKGRLTAASTATSAQLLSLLNLGVGHTNSAGTLLLNIVAGANVTFSTNGSAITISASSGSTNSGTAVSVDAGGTLSAANFADTSEIDGTATGTNVGFALKTTGVGAGTFTGLVATVDSKGRLTAASTATSAQLLSLLNLGVGHTNSAGTLLLNIVAGANVSFSTNGSAITISASGSGGGGDVYASSNNTFASSNTFLSYLYLRGTNSQNAIVFHDTNGPGNSDLSGFYTSDGDLVGFTAGTNLGARVVWLHVRRNAAYDNPDTITISALNQIILNAPVTNLFSFGAPTLYAGTKNVGSALDAAANQFTWVPSGFQPGTNLYALANTTNSTPIRVFDPDTEWNYRYVVVPPGSLSALPSTIRVKSFWRPIIGNSASQTIIVAAKYEGVVDSDSFTVANNVTNTVSSQTWIAFTNTLGTSNMTIGTPFVLNISAPAAGSATNLYQMQEGIGVFWY